MSDELPPWNAVRSLVEQHPKPAMKASIVEVRDGTAYRSAVVLHDGQEGWLIEDERGTVVSFGDRSWMQDHAGEPLLAVRGGQVASGNWVKVLLDGRRMAYLAESTGVVTGVATVAGLSCWVATVSGLKTDGTTFTLSVDQLHGIVLKVEGPSASVEVERIEFAEGL